MRPARGMCASSSTHGWGNHQQVNTTLSSAPNCMEGVKQVSKQTISIWDPAQHAAQPQAVSMTCTVVGTSVWWGKSTMTMTCTVVGWLLHPLGEMEPEAPMHSLQSVKCLLSYCMWFANNVHQQVRLMPVLALHHQLCIWTTTCTGQPCQFTMSTRCNHAHAPTGSHADTTPIMAHDSSMPAKPTATLDTKCLRPQLQQPAGAKKLKTSR
jgi:hypothetical protein